MGFAAVDAVLIVWVDQHRRWLGGVPGDGCILGGLRHAQAVAASCGGLVGQRSPSTANLRQGHGTDADLCPQVGQGFDDLGAVGGDGVLRVHRGFFAGAVQLLLRSCRWLI